MNMYRVNVSSIQDFYQCRFRWWCKWVMNRVPRAEGPALGAGKLLHLIFEDAHNGVRSLSEAYEYQTEKFYAEVKATQDPEQITTAMRSIETIRDLSEALPLWKDKYHFTEMLECEKPFEVVLPEYAEDIMWLGRPDYMGVCSGRVWHRQNRGLAASTNFGTYLTLAKRHYHEHLYAEYARVQYPEHSIGGTIFNLVRKLKYRTNVGKKNEATKSYDEMFFQHPMSISLPSPLHQNVMRAMTQHVREMQAVIARGEAPAPNEKMNGGFSGNSIDPFFRVLVREVKLSDDKIFMDRKDTYAPVVETEG